MTEILKNRWICWVEGNYRLVGNSKWVRWYGHVLQRDDDSVSRVALNLKVSGKRKRGRPKKTWKKQVKEEEIGLKNEDALNRDKWRDGVRAIAEGMSGFGHLCQGKRPDKN